jgi:hypothetical protein
MATPSQKVLSAALYVVYLCAVVLAADYIFFWRPFVNELRHTEKPRNFDCSDLGGSSEGSGVGAVAAETFRLLGVLTTSRESSFVRFEPTKPVGITRVCAFGDSFT